MNSIKKAFTHAGIFHADDVFSAALLTYLYPEIEIERGVVAPEYYDGIVFDIGLGEFDHHQLEKEIRQNGIPYAAFGLLWRKFGEEILGSEEAEKFDKKFVQKIDFSDNTGAYHELSSFISNFNSCWDEEREENKAFEEAKQVALLILKRYFKKIKSIERAQEIVKEAIKEAEEGILILPQAVPWKQAVKDTDIKFVIFESNRGGYCVQGVPKEEESEVEEENTIKELKCYFPEEWRGKKESELREITRIETITFCHTSGFLAAVKTLEDAKKAARLALGIPE